MPVTITNIRTILTAPDGVRLVVVRVDTSEPGLYGLGCATFTQRPLAVAAAVDEYLRPFLTGREVDDIEDIWQSAFVSSYWRSGPVLNNALSGVDQALWDIKGKRAGMPVYQLLGGKCRDRVPLYCHTHGRDPEEVADRAREAMAQGYRHVRAQVHVPGYSTYGASGRDAQQAVWEPAPYMRTAVRLFEHLRAELGEEIELLHDIHERIPPIQAINLAKQLERFNLFFLEDPFAPEDIGYFPILRQQTSIPIAMGELFSNVNEYLPLIQGRLIDFIRVHVSTIGGLSPARKL
ncbi:MAG TPA: enolase C-terminal domain-like protein, partial [Armatimonadota bacterium]|nr:enolase C-terminal domain-like protein [Armatimonadota bacterium]